MEASAQRFPRPLGRYLLHDELGSGGMATVHFARLVGPPGFSRVVAIKRLHPHLAKDAVFAKMFLDEARVALRVRHPNVVSTLDVVMLEDEAFLVMEYVHGEPLSTLLRRARPDPAPPPIAAAIVCNLLHGLHAAHEAKDEQGEPLRIVHRDVSPQNVLVGVDGLARVLDFGVARAVGQLQTTRAGQLKGKLGYMAPEQLRAGRVDRRTDVFAAGALLWEALTGQALFVAGDDATTMMNILDKPVPAPSAIVPGLSAAFDAVTERALNRDPSKRFGTARQMAIALESSVPIATATQLGEWVEDLAGPSLLRRRRMVEGLERGDAPANVSPSVDPAEKRSPSSISAVTPQPRSTERRRSRAGAAGAAIALALVGAFVLVPYARRRSAAAPDEGLSRASAPPQPRDQAPPFAPASTDSEHAGPSPSPSAPASGVASTAMAPKQAPASSPRSRQPRRAPSAPSPGRGCDPPYFVDSAGIEIPKPECLK